jgi:hypothetical protein
LFGPGLRSAATTFLNQHRTLVPFLETGIKAAVFAAVPMPPEAKASVNSLLDLYTDGLRKSLNERDDDRSEVVLMETSTTFKSGFNKLLGELAAQRKVKPSFESLLMGLEDDKEKEMVEWIAWIPLNSKQYAQEWIRFRSRIGSKEVLERLCLIEGQPVPVDITGVTRRTMEMEAKTLARMSFLEGLYGERPTTPETVGAFLAGEETPYTKKIVDGLNKAKDDAVGSIAKSDEKIAAVKARNATIVVPVAHRNVALVMLAVLLGACCVMLYIILW